MIERDSVKIDTWSLFSLVPSDFSSHFFSSIRSESIADANFPSIALVVVGAGCFLVGLRDQSDRFDSVRDTCLSRASCCSIFA